MKRASILELDEQMQELKARLELVEQIKKAKQEQEEKERLEKERLEKERLEKERLEKERLEKEKLEKEDKDEKDRLEKERASEQSSVDETTGVKKERKKKEAIPKASDRTSGTFISDQPSTSIAVCVVKKPSSRSQSLIVATLLLKVLEAHTRLEICAQFARRVTTQWGLKI